MRRPILPAETYIEGILSGNRVLLGQAITLVESARPEHQERAREVIAGLLQKANPTQPSLRIAITGAPGAGKSTFIEALGTMLTGQGKKVAVLAIDPSSALSKGSILGDKTRMEHLSTSELAFIRPSPAGETLGGVARKTRETILLVEAAGYDTVFVETVGVGQSETTAKSMTDLFLLLLLPGAGDELQGIKRGIVEMADLIAINKADGERKGLAMRAKREYATALHLFPPKNSGWTPQTALCSAFENFGITEIWKQLLAYCDLTARNGYFQYNRMQQARYWLYESIQSHLNDLFYRNEQVQEQLQKVESAVLEGNMTPFKGAAMLMKIFSGSSKMEK